MLRRSKTDSVDPTGAMVLVVSDDEDRLELLCRLFESRGYQTKTSGEVDDAIIQVQIEQPHIDAVVVDYRHAGTGPALEICDRIRANDNHDVQDCRLIIATEIDENRVFSWQSGVDGFLVRPFDAETLLETLKMSLQMTNDERHTHRDEQQALASDPRTRRVAGEPI